MEYRQNVFYGHNITTKEQLDFIVRRKISEIVGSQEEELKIHRLAIAGLYLQMNPDAFGGSRRGEIDKIREKILPIFISIEKIVNEGNELCKKAGWTH